MSPVSGFARLNFDSLMHDKTDPANVLEQLTSAIPQLAFVNMHGWLGFSCFFELTFVQHDVFLEMLLSCEQESTIVSDSLPSLNKATMDSPECLVICKL